MNLKQMLKLVMSEMGKKGGPARAKALTKKRRSEIARKAGAAGAAARWGVKMSMGPKGKGSKRKAGASI